ncbi:S8 family peptidase [Halococcus sediminicola]|uniref:S8 family peptidase n=1 Tax=Halococcus sediminicola TaxID=1264579 RepID=UPI0009AE0FAA|nr:S8 family serine peptidase [Halococcus sediminicola]
MEHHSRRRFLKLTGIAGAGLTFGTLPVAAEGQSERFLIDLREVSRSAVSSDVEVIHDLGEIDVLVAAGDPESVGGPAATAPDVALDMHDDDEDDDGESGPVKERDDDDEDDDGEESELPERRALQWDKHVQELEEEVHETTRGAGSRVAVVDAGVYDAHPDLDGVVNDDLSKNFTTDEYDFRPNGAGDHGTHVSGIVAATNDYEGERGGVLGTAPETELLGLRVFSGREAASGDVMAALVYAANQNCDAANLSLGFPAYVDGELQVDPEEYPFLLTYKRLYERAVAYANERGTVVVNSAGNDAIDLDPEDVLGIPTEAEGIFAVSATGPIGYVWDDEREDDEVDVEEALDDLREPTTQPAKYTTYGESVLDVSAAGGNYDPEALAEADDGDADNPKWFYDLVVSTTVTTTYEDGPDEDDTGSKPSEIVDTEPSYGFKAGTSMAAPQVTGAVALVRSLRPEMGVREVESLIRSTARDVGDPDYHGDGHLDLTALVRAIAGDDDEDDDDEDENEEEEEEDENEEEEEEEDEDDD